ncbi:MAG: transglycosylase domain-containing protein [Polyangia bacterium]
MTEPGDFEPRSEIVTTYRPPRPSWWRKAWPILLGTFLLIIAIPLGLVVAEVVVVTDRNLPHIDHLEDYHPLSTTQLFTTSGELVGEVGGAHRLVLGTKGQTPALVNALLAHVEPKFMERPPLGQRQLLRALWARLTGKELAPPLSVKLATSLTRERWGVDDHGVAHLMRDWLVAIRMEFRLTRAEIVGIYLDQLAFGGGGYGAQVGAYGLFGSPVDKLDAKQLAELVAHDRDEPGMRPTTTPSIAAPCGEIAIARLGVHYPPEVLARLGARVVTTCEIDRTKTVLDAIARQHLDRMGLSAAAAVMRLPGHELVALTGVHDAKHPVGVLRAPFVIGSALASLKWTAISPLVQNGMKLTLREATARSPAATADALLAAGLPGAPVLDVITRAGIPGSPSAGDVCDGHAPITMTDATELLATLASDGDRSEPVLIRSVTVPGQKPVPLPEKARISALTPEATYLVGSLLSKPVRSPLGRPSAGLTGTENGDTWLGLYTPDVVVAVWLGAKDSNTPSRGGEVERTAIAIGLEIVQSELKGKRPTPFKQPDHLFVRRIDDHGLIVGRGISGGTPELFVPGSAHREETEIVPDADPGARP